MEAGAAAVAVAGSLVAGRSMQTAMWEAWERWGCLRAAAAAVSLRRLASALMMLAALPGASRERTEAAGPMEQTEGVGWRTERREEEAMEGRAERRRLP